MQALDRIITDVSRQTGERTLTDGTRLTSASQVSLLEQVPESSLDVTRRTIYRILTDVAHSISAAAVTDVIRLTGDRILTEGTRLMGV